MTLGEKIQLSRKKKGMSQEDLANLLNVSRQAVQKWENDTSIPEVNKLVEISNIFEVSLDWLLKGVNQEQKETKEENNVENNSATSNASPQQNQYQPNYYPRPRGGIFTTARVFIVLGMILTPMVIASSIVAPTGSPLGLIGLVAYVFTIPLGVTTIRKLNTAQDKREVIPWGVITFILVSALGGILVLSINDNLFKDGNHPASPHRVYDSPTTNYVPPKKELSPKELKEQERKGLYALSILIRLGIGGLTIATFVLSIVTWDSNGIKVAAYLMMILSNIYTLVICAFRSKYKFNICYLLDVGFLFEVCGAILLVCSKNNGVDLAAFILGFVSGLITLLLMLVLTLLRKHEVKTTEEAKEEGENKINRKALIVAGIVLVNCLIIGLTAPISNSIQKEGEYSTLIKLSKKSPTDSNAREFYYFVRNYDMQNYKDSTFYISDFYLRRLDFILDNYSYSYYSEMSSTLVSWFNVHTYQHSYDSVFKANNIHNYNKARDMAQNYSNITDAKTLRGYINQLSNEYLDSETIKDYFTKIENIRSEFGNGSISSGKYDNPTTSQSQIYRNYLNQLANMDLSSTFFDLTKLVASFDIRKTFFGETWTSSDGQYSFIWKMNDEGTGQQISYNIPNAKEDGKQYYFGMNYDYDYYSTSKPNVVTNSVIFYLENASDQNDKFNLIKVSNLTYTSYYINVKVHIYYDNSDILMRIAR